MRTLPKLDQQTQKPRWNAVTEKGQRDDESIVAGEVCSQIGEPTGHFGQRECLSNHRLLSRAKLDFQGIKEEV